MIAVIRACQAVVRMVIVTGQAAAVPILMVQSAERRHVAEQGSTPTLSVSAVAARLKITRTAALITAVVGHACLLVRRILTATQAAAFGAGVAAARA